MSFNLNLLKYVDKFETDVDTLTNLQKMGIYNLWDIYCETVES